MAVADRKDPTGPAEPAPKGMTLLESDDEMRQYLMAKLGEKPTAKADVSLFRPKLRPSMALLVVCDDGAATGETFRLRGDRTIIGRADGDIRIPHDELMSARHVEITRIRVGDGFSWTLTDLQSTNGTFARVSRTVLNADSEILVGRGRFRFESATAAETVDHAPPGTTRPWGEGVSAAAEASLVEVMSGGKGQRFALRPKESWIGRDAGCTVARPDDPFVSPRHARLHCDAQGRWHVANNKAVNGVWLRVGTIPISGGCQFQLGEQRFLLKILS
jgi:pSer/pThr/pTyr-binding forkhead associated (FHA) protein